MFLFRTPFLHAVSLSVLLGLASAARATAPAPAAAAPAANPREIIPFDANWRFNLADDAAAKQPAFDDAKWRTLDVPHDWSVEGPAVRPPEGDGNNGFFIHGIGWYRKSFTLPAATTGKKVVIEFDGVYMNSDVWINGQFLGRKPYGFTDFRYDLTLFLRPAGTPNVIAVRVDDSAEPSTRWYSGSGIYRHVRLITTSYTHFRLDGGITVTTPEVTADQAVVEAKYTLDAHFFTEEERAAIARNSGGAAPAARPVVLRSSVLAPDGSVVASTESTLNLQAMHRGQLATQRITVPKPRLWSDVTPELYRLRSTLTLPDRTLDESVTTFGIRKLEYNPDRGLLVNGKSTKLKGVCLHQDAGSFGNAAPAGVWAYRIARLKEMGCNAIRTSHHPFAPEFYDLCDQMGMYVFDEAFDEWTRDWAYNYAENPRGKAPSGYHLYFNQWHDTDLRAMLRRDRNHPSVVLWSIGNEVPDQLDFDGYKIAKELVAICHEEDSTRPVTAGCDRSAIASRNGFMDELDIGGYNYIDRIYNTQTYVPERARFPKRLLVGTETSHAIHMWLGVRNNDYVIGDFIWTGIDYLGESGTFPRRGSGSGSIDLANGKKLDFYQRAAYWRDDPVLQLTVSGASAAATTAPGRGGAGAGRGRGGGGNIAWTGNADAPMTVRALTNCNEVELFLNDKSLGRHTVSLDLYNSEWTVPYAAGKLAAVGYRAGKQAVTNELRTNGAAARLQVTPQQASVYGDLTFYEITVVDAAGVNVPDATPAVTVKVEGPGRLIGMDTGDLSYVGLFKTDTRNAYQGRLLATVQRTAAGDIRLTAAAPGLTAATAPAK